MSWKSFLDFTGSLESSILKNEQSKDNSLNLSMSAILKFKLVWLLCLGLITCTAQSTENINLIPHSSVYPATGESVTYFQSPENRYLLEDDFTICFDLKWSGYPTLDPATTESVILSQKENTDGFTLSIIDSKLALYFDGHETDSGFTLTVDQEYRVTITYLKATNTISYYVDGTFINSHTETPFQISPSALSIANDVLNPSEALQFHGELANLQIYDAASNTADNWNLSESSLMFSQANLILKSNDGSGQHEHLSFEITPSNTSLSVGSIGLQFEQKLIANYGTYHKYFQINNNSNYTITDYEVEFSPLLIEIDSNGYMEYAFSKKPLSQYALDIKVTLDSGVETVVQNHISLEQGHLQPGFEFTEHNIGVDNVNKIRYLTFVDGQFIGIGSADTPGSGINDKSFAMGTSTDGVNWTYTMPTVPGSMNRWPHLITHLNHNGTTKLVCYNYNPNQGMIVSDDYGATWSHVPLNSAGFRDVATDGTRILAVNSSGQIYETTDGISFSHISSVNSNTQSITYQNGKWYTCAQGGGIRVSSNDGQSFSSISSQATLWWDVIAVNSEDEILTLGRTSSSLDNFGHSNESGTQIISYESSGPASGYFNGLSSSYNVGSLDYIEELDIFILGKGVTPGHSYKISADAKNWYTVEDLENTYTYGSVYGNGKIVTLSNTGQLYVSETLNNFISFEENFESYPDNHILGTGTELWDLHRGGGVRVKNNTLMDTKVYNGLSGGITTAQTEMKHPLDGLQSASKVRVSFDAYASLSSPRTHNNHVELTSDNRVNDIRIGFINNPNVGPNPSIYFSIGDSTGYISYQHLYDYDRELFGQEIYLEFDVDFESEKAHVKVFKNAELKLELTDVDIPSHIATSVTQLNIMADFRYGGYANALIDNLKVTPIQNEESVLVDLYKKAILNETYSYQLQPLNQNDPAWEYHLLSGPQGLTLSKGGEIYYEAENLGTYRLAIQLIDPITFETKYTTLNLEVIDNPFKTFKLDFTEHSWGDALDVNTNFINSEGSATTIEITDATDIHYIYNESAGTALQLGNSSPTQNPISLDDFQLTPHFMLETHVRLSDLAANESLNLLTLNSKDGQNKSLKMDLTSNGTDLFISGDLNGHPITSNLDSSAWQNTWLHLVAEVKHNTIEGTYDIHFYKNMSPWGSSLGIPEDNLDWPNFPNDLVSVETLSKNFTGKTVDVDFVRLIHLDQDYNNNSQSIAYLREAQTLTPFIEDFESYSNGHTLGSASDSWVIYEGGGIKVDTAAQLPTKILNGLQVTTPQITRVFHPVMGLAQPQIRFSFDAYAFSSSPRTHNTSIGLQDSNRSHYILLNFTNHPNTGARYLNVVIRGDQGGTESNTIALDTGDFYDKPFTCIMDVDYTTGKVNIKIASEGQLAYTFPELDVPAYILNKISGIGILNDYRYTGEGYNNGFFDNLELKEMPAPTTPVVTTPTLKGFIDEAMTGYVTATDTDYSTFTYSLISGPPGLTLSPSGQIDWLPDTAGHYPVQVQVDASSGLSETAEFNIDVLEFTDLRIDFNEDYWGSAPTFETDYINREGPSANVQVFFYDDTEFAYNGLSGTAFHFGPTSSIGSHIYIGERPLHPHLLIESRFKVSDLNINDTLKVFRFISEPLAQDHIELTMSTQDGSLLDLDFTVNNQTFQATQTISDWKDTWLHFAVEIKYNEGLNQYEVSFFSNDSKIGDTLNLVAGTDWNWDLFHLSSMDGTLFVKDYQTNTVDIDFFRIIDLEQDYDNNANSVAYLAETNPIQPFSEDFEGFSHGHILGSGSDDWVITRGQGVQVSTRPEMPTQILNGRYEAGSEISVLTTPIEGLGVGQEPIVRLTYDLHAFANPGDNHDTHNTFLGFSSADGKNYLALVIVNNLGGAGLQDRFTLRVQSESGMEHIEYQYDPDLFNKNLTVKLDLNFVERTFNIRLFDGGILVHQFNEYTVSQEVINTIDSLAYLIDYRYFTIWIGSLIDNIELDVKPDFEPPTIELPTQEAMAGLEFNYQMQASDGEGSTMTYSLLSGPAGLTVSPSGVIQWTPSTQGTFGVQVQVDASTGETSTIDFNLVVNQPKNILLDFKEHSWDEAPTLSTTFVDETGTASPIIYDADENPLDTTYVHNGLGGTALRMGLNTQAEMFYTDNYHFSSKFIFETRFKLYHIDTSGGLRIFGTDGDSTGEPFSIHIDHFDGNDLKVSVVTDSTTDVVDQRITNWDNTWVHFATQFTYDTINDEYKFEFFLNQQALGSPIVIAGADWTWSAMLNSNINFEFYETLGSPIDIAIDFIRFENINEDYASNQFDQAYLSEAYVNSDSGASVVIDGDASQANNENFLFKKVSNPPADFGLQGLPNNGVSIDSFSDSDNKIFYGVFEINFGLENEQYDGDVEVDILIKNDLSPDFKWIGSRTVNISQSSGIHWQSFYWNSRGPASGDGLDGFASWSSADAANPYAGQVEFKFLVR